MKLFLDICVLRASLVAQLVKNLPAMQETPVWFLGWEDPLEKLPIPVSLGFPGGSDSKESPTLRETWVWSLGLIPGSERSPGGGHSNPLQYSCLENPMDRRAWWATVHRVAKSQTWLKWLSTQQTCSLCSLEWVSLFSKLTCNHRLTSLNT